jgi:two-component system LytT family response regulator
MIKAVIIDDEAHGRNALEVLLNRNITGLEITGHADSVKSGFRLIEKLQPQLVFLDIRMGDGTGFDLLKKFEEINFEVIFTTAFDSYALHAFEHSAIGYLLKPLEEEEIIKVVGKAIKLLGIEKSVQKEKIDKLMFINELHAYKGSRLLLPESNGYIFINTNEIIRLEADRNYTRIFQINKQPLISSFNLGWFEQNIEKYGFFRISKSHLINLSHIERYIKASGGIIIMDDKTQISISDSKKEEFRKLFEF